MHNQIIQKDPAELSAHPLLRFLPEWSNDDPRFAALVDDVKLQGIIEPLKITSSGLIADGRHRWRAAKRLQLKTVPCIIIPDEQVPLLTIATLLHRRHYTPGQRAYLAAPTLDDAFDAAQKRMLAGKTPDPRNSVPRDKSLDDWATEIGVTVRYLREARRLRELFAEHKDKTWTWNDADVLEALGLEPDAELTFQQYYEPQLLAEEDPIGLGAAVAGIGQRIAMDKRGGAHDGGQPREIEKQRNLFEKTFYDLAVRFDYWKSFPPALKLAALEPFTVALEKMPDDLLSMMTKKVKAESRRRKKSKSTAQCDADKIRAGKSKKS